MWNAAFQPDTTEYSGRYEETQSFSGTFNKFHRDLAQRLIDKYGLRHKDIVEIGCGKGEFLLLLCELGPNRGVGIDPGVDMERLEGRRPDQVTFIPEFYSAEHMDRNVDFVVCKMTFEHIPDVLHFLTAIREGLANKKDAIVFFQIPEARRIIETVAFEDIYYEHCSYYSAGSLARLFRRAGFDVLNLATEYDGQYLTIEARPSSGSGEAPMSGEDDLDSLHSLVTAFPERWARKLGDWRDRLDKFRRDGKTVALWGSGSKAVSFITTLGVENCVHWVTDINPHRHHHFMPKSAHPIFPPVALAEHRPDVVIAMNRVYRDEIQRDLDSLGLDCELLTL
jgi:SAM-dependent methyltransferase